MTQNEYIWAWAVYLLGVAMLMGIYWYWTSKLRWKEFNHFSRLSLAIVFLVPWYTDASKEYLSPAWLVSLADLLFYGPKEFWRAGLIVVLALAIAWALSTIYFIVRWFQSRQKPDTKPDTV